MKDKSKIPLELEALLREESVKPIRTNLGIAYHIRQLAAITSAVLGGCAVGQLALDGNYISAVGMGMSTLAASLVISGAVKEYLETTSNIY